MKKAIVAAVIIVLFGGLGFLVSHKPGTAPIIAAPSATQAVKSTGACKMFTLTNARQILGSGAVAGTVVPDTSTSALTVSTCLYANGSTSPTDIQTASILVRTARNSVGRTSNTTGFASQKVGNQAVAGYGSSAFWSATLGQLNVLKNNSWLIVSVGPADPTTHTLSQTESLAQIILPKL